MDYRPGRARLAGNEPDDGAFGTTDGGTTMSGADVELGPVDYVMVAFPAGEADFSGEMASEMGLDGEQRSSSPTSSTTAPEPLAGKGQLSPRQAPPDTAEVAGSAGVSVQVGASFVRKPRPGGCHGVAVQAVGTGHG
jgi:hypothetical protein